jgi:hypothetical protein
MMALKQKRELLYCEVFGILSLEVDMCFRRGCDLHFILLSY